jgi:hypothetical protein
LQILFEKLSFSSFIGDDSFFMVSKGTRRKINVLNHGCGAGTLSLWKFAKTMPEKFKLASLRQ